MPQVSVNDSAYIDARLRLASQLLNMNHECLGWRLIQVWSLVTTRSSTILPVALVSVAIGESGTDVARAFIAAQLAEPADDDLDLSPMQTMFSDCNCLQNQKDMASVDSGKRDRPPREPLHQRIVEQLGVDHHTRKQLREALGCRRADMLAAVRDLVANGVVVEEDGLLLLARAVPGTDAAEPVPGTDEEPGTGNAEPVPGTDTGPGTDNAEPIPGTDREPATEYPEPHGNRPGTGTVDLYSVPGTMREPSTRNREPAHNATREGTDREPPTRDNDPLDSEEIVPQEQRRAAARLLWDYQNQCRIDLDPSAPALPFDDMPGGPLDAVILRLAAYTPSQCRHALDMFTLEARDLSDDENPLEYLNGFTNWKPEPFSRRVARTRIDD